MAYNIFISYSTKDSEIARRFQACFQNIRGVSVFLSETNLIVGQVSAAILQQIRNCDIFIVLYSKNSRDSAYVQQEIGAAKSQSKIIIPVVLDEEARPDAMLAGVNYLSRYDSTKWVSQSQRLYEYIVTNSNQKSSNEAIGAMILGGLFLYALSEE